MDKRKMTKLGNGGSERDPIVAYYKFKEPNPAYPKEKQFKAGDKFYGTYQFTFVKNAQGYIYKDHLIKTEDKGSVTLANCTALNDLEGLARDTYVEIEYLGKGKPKAGKKPPYLFSVSVDKSAAPSAGKKKKEVAPIIHQEELPEEDAEEDGDGVPF